MLCYTEIRYFLHKGDSFVDAALQKQAKKTFSAVGFALTLFFAVSLGVQVLLDVLYGILAPSLPPLPAPAVTDVLILLSSVSMYLFAFPAMLLFLRKVERHAPRRTSVRAGEIFTLLLISVFFLYFGNNVGLFLGSLFENTGLALKNTTIDAVAQSNSFLTLLLTVVIAPIIEEWIFRKTIIDCVGAYGEKLAILFSALLFGFFHANLYQFFYAVLIGLVLGYAYVRTGKLWVTALLHAAVNFIGMLPLLLNKFIPIFEFAEELASFGAGDDPLELFEYLLPRLPTFAVMYQFSVAESALVLFGAVLFFIYVRRLWFARTQTQLARDSEGVTAFAAPGVLLFVLASLALTVYQSAI